IGVGHRSEDARQHHTVRICLCAIRQTLIPKFHLADSAKPLAWRMISRASKKRAQDSVLIAALGASRERKSAMLHDSPEPQITRQEEGARVVKYRCIAALAALCWCGAVGGQDYPNKPVRVLLPTPAGSTPDRMARLITPGLSTLFGQQFIVDNRSGADGMLGTELAAKATPDGYTLLVGTPGMLTIMRYVQKDVPYDTLR